MSPTEIRGTSDLRAKRVMNQHLTSSRNCDSNTVGMLAVEFKLVRETPRLTDKKRN